MKIELKKILLLGFSGLIFIVGKPGWAQEPAGEIPDLLASPEADARIKGVEMAETLCAERAEGACAWIGALARLLTEDPAIEVRIRSARALGAIREERAVEPLISAARFSGSSELKRACIESLSVFLEERVEKVLEEIGRTDPDPEVQKAAQAALWKMKEEIRSETAGKRFILKDPDPTRMVYSSTAFPLEKGQAQWTIHELGYWMFKHNPTENITIQFHTVVPIGVLVLGPSIKITGEISPHARAGVLGEVLFFTPYVEESDFFAVAYGGGPLLTLGSRDYYVNFASLMYGGYEEDDGDGEDGYVVLPEIGTGLRISRRAAFHAEYIFTIPSKHEETGELTFFMYGIRIFGESVFGDINFVMPIYDGMDEYLDYLPMGFPLLVFGFNW